MEHGQAAGWIARVFDGPEVSLPQMLDAREHRAAEQRRALVAAGDGAALVSLTLAIPGPVKTSAVLRRVFERFVDEILQALKGYRASVRTALEGACGPEAFIVVHEDARLVKRLVLAIEESDALGRLSDADVLWVDDGSLRAVSRVDMGMSERRCLLCGAPAKECARSRAHSVEEMQGYIAHIIEQEGLIRSDEED